MDEDATDEAGTPDGPEPTPIERIGVHTLREVEITPDLVHLEGITSSAGMLTVLWHGPRDADRVVACCGGAFGGLLGPGDSLWHSLGVALAEQGIGTMRISYRQPNNPAPCVRDVIAMLETAQANGARRAVTLGHSFGGAVAIRAAVGLPDLVVAVATFATQIAGSEVADQLADKPLLLFHGDADTILPAASSAMVAKLHGNGELVMLPGAGHRLTEAADELLERCLDWIPEMLAEPAPAQGGTT